MMSDEIVMAPGDTLVLRAQRPLTIESMVMIKQDLEAQGIRAVVVSHDLDVSVVTQPKDDRLEGESGYEYLWRKVSYTGWLTIPRVLMHEMPDDWQGRMAQLIEEYEGAWVIPDEYSCEVEVSLKQNGKYIKMYDWIDYRHPNVEMLQSWMK